MDKAFHPTAEELHLYLDGELSGDDLRHVQIHLRRCTECSQQLDHWASGAALYRSYHDSVLQSGRGLEVPAWKTIAERAARPASPKPYRWWLAGATAAAAAFLLIVVGYYRWEQAKTAEATALIARAESSSLPESHTLRFDMAGQTWLRQPERAPTGQAVQHVRSLFLRASYNWEHPLSVRSLASWRQRLARKSDDVLLIRNARGEKYAYRLSTRTPRGLLRSVSLTLRSDTYHPTAASFQFEGQDRLDVSEEPEPVGRPSPRSETAPAEKFRAEHVGPEEELRVIAALNRIAADVDDAVSVRLDQRAKRVVVNGWGLAAERQRAISQALANDPAVALRFDSGPPASSTSAREPQPFAQNSHQPAAASGYRARLEQNLGGVRKWQAMSDTALAATARILAHAHASLQLQQDFGPRVETRLSAPGRQTLYDLLKSHSQAILAATTEVKDALKSVMTLAVNETSAPTAGATWQDHAIHLYQQSRLLDEDANRFLIDDYDEPAARQLKTSIARALARLENLADTLENVNRGASDAH